MAHRSQELEQATLTAEWGCNARARHITPPFEQVFNLSCAPQRLNEDTSEGSEGGHSDLSSPSSSAMSSPPRVVSDKKEESGDQSRSNGYCRQGTRPSCMR